MNDEDYGCEITIDGRVEHPEGKWFDAERVLDELKVWLGERGLKFEDGCYLDSWTNPKDNPVTSPGTTPPDRPV